MEPEMFELSFVYLMTFAEKIVDGKRELIVRGNDIVLRMGRRIVDDDMHLICMFLHVHPEVNSLDLAYNKITDKGFQALVEFLWVHNSLTRLNLMCNNIKGKGIQALTKMEGSMPLKTLRLNGNRIGPQGGKYLSELLLHTNLQLLDMGETDQTISSLVFFTSALMQNSKLLMLDLSRPLGAHMYIFDKSHWAETIGRMLELNKTLRELHLQKTGLSDIDIELLMQGMSNNHTLLLLDLSCNHIGNEGIRLLGEYLYTRPALLGLLLGSNVIGDDGALSLSFTLPYSRLQLLDLSHNQLTDAGMLALLNTIKKPVMLRALYIWGNDIQQDACKVIRRMLSSKVLVQERLDIKLYHVNGVSHVAFNPVNRSRHIYYCVNDYGFPPPKRILPPRLPSIPTQLVCPRASTRPKVCPCRPPHFCM